MVTYNYNSVPMLTLDRMSEEPIDKVDKAKDVITTKEGSTLHLVLLSSQTMIPPGQEEILLDASDSKGLLHKRALSEWDTTEVWKMVASLMTHL